MKILCPLCRSPLAFDPASKEERISCTGCDSSFNTDRIRQAIQQVIKADAASTQTAPRESAPKTNAGARPKPHAQPKPTEQPNSGTAPKPDSQPREQVSVQDEAPVNIAVGNLKVAPAPFSPSERKRRRSKMRILTMFGLGAACVALLTTLIVIIQNQPEDNALPTQLLEDASDALAIGSETNNEQTNQAVNDLPEAPALETEEVKARTTFSTVDEVSKPAPKPVNRIKVKGILDDCWLRTRNYLVELQADTPSGPKLATGTIIDSRGWVVTSHQAMAGASKIHVRKANDLSNPPAERVVDQVRGIVAERPEHDLIILAINRQLVDTFEDIPFETEDKVVSSRYLVQCQPPTALFPYASNETRIDQRSPLSGLSGTNGERMKRIGLDEEINWIVHKQKSPLRAGSILLDDDGKLLAMNTAASANYDDFAFAIPAAYIENLRSTSNDGQLKPLATAQAATSSTPDDDPFSDEEDDTEVDVDSGEAATRDISMATLQELTETVNRTGTECELFGWWPETEPQDDLFRQFIQAFGTIEQRLDRSTDDSDSQQAAMVELIGDWKKKLELGLGIEADKDRDSQIAFNQKFAGLTSGKNVFAGYAFVKHPASESPIIPIGRNAEAGDTIVFEFKGTSALLITNTKAEWPPMPPDSPWLVIGSTIAGRIRLGDGQTKTKPIEMAKVEFAIQAN